MGTAGLTNCPLLITPVGVVTRSSVATLSHCRGGAERVEVWVEPGLKTGKADEVEGKKGGNEFIVCISKGKTKRLLVGFLYIVQSLK